MSDRRTSFGWGVLSSTDVSVAASCDVSVAGGTSRSESKAEPELHSESNVGLSEEELSTEQVGNLGGVSTVVPKNGVNNETPEPPGKPRRFQEPGGSSRIPPMSILSLALAAGLASTMSTGAIKIVAGLGLAHHWRGGRPPRTSSVGDMINGLGEGAATSTEAPGDTMVAADAAVTSLEETMEKVWKEGACSCFDFLSFVQLRRGHRKNIVVEHIILPLTDVCPRIRRIILPLTLPLTDVYVVSFCVGAGYVPFTIHLL